VILRIPIGGYTLNQQTVDALEVIKDDRLLFRCTFDVQPGGIDAATTGLADATTPKLLIVESAGQGDQVFQQLEALANVCDPDTRLILIGVQNDIDLYRTLIQYGVSDYLIAPVDAEMLRESIAKVYEGADVEENGRVIAFTGMTGGVGSSVISHNVANELAIQYEAKVIVLDMDICYGTAGLNFNLQPRQTIVDAIGQAGNLDGSLLDQYFMPFEERISILASPASLTTGVTFKSETVNALLKSVAPMGDFIILDLPHIWESWVSDTLNSADEVVLVSKPDLTSLRNGKNMVEYLGPKRGVDAPTRLLLNQVGAAKRADLSNKDFKEALALEPSASIPYDPDTFGKALNTGEMMSKVSAKNKATAAIAEFAKIISAREEVEEEGGKKKIFALFNKKKD